MAHINHRGNFEAHDIIDDHKVSLFIDRHGIFSFTVDGTQKMVSREGNAGQAILYWVRRMFNLAVMMLPEGLRIQFEASTDEPKRVALYRRFARQFAHHEEEEVDYYIQFAVWA